MLHKLLSDSRFFCFLLLIDQDMATRCHDDPCPKCSGVLDAAHFPRKPRGHLPNLPDGFEVRFSFCCRNDGCRRRQTPASVRFLDRRVYLGAIVVIVAAMLHGAKPDRVAKMRQIIGADWHTIVAWRHFWETTFPRSDRGRELRASLQTAPPSCDLFHSLWRAAILGACMGPNLAEKLVRFLCLLTRNVTQIDGTLIKELAGLCFPQEIPKAQP